MRARKRPSVFPPPAGRTQGKGTGVLAATVCCKGVAIVHDVYDPAELQPASQRAGTQEVAFRRVVERAITVSPALRQALEAAGVSPERVTLADLPRIPLLKKESLPGRQGEAPPWGGWLARPLPDVRPRGLIGTPSFLALVLDKVSERGARSSLEVGFVSGEPLSESLRTDLESRHRMRIGQAYAIGDIGLIAYECSQRTGLHVAERVVVEIVDPATGARLPDGEMGEVAVSFLSDLYPLLRLGTGDLSRIAPGSCACGRTSARLERIFGRVGDAVKVRGIFLHPHDLDRAMARYPEVARYQAVVTRREHQDELTVRLETGGPQTRLGGAVADSVREVTRLRAIVEVLPPGTLGPNEKKLVDLRKWD